MSCYLLDTHVLIWMRKNDRRLDRGKWEPVFFDRSNEILFSIEHGAVAVTNDPKWHHYPVRLDF